MKLIDLTGQRFGRLVVLEIDGRNHSGSATWRCRCDCGTATRVSSGQLRTGATRSCGCLARDVTRERSQTQIIHGHARRSGNSPAFRSWTAMLQRCLNPHTTGYARYGGRGITVCGRWHEFAAFLADMGERPRGTTLDRIDNAKGYEPGNCRWATPREQSNNKRTSVTLTLRGETHTIAEWARTVGVPVTTIRHRLDTGWDAERAVYSPRVSFAEAGRRSGAARRSSTEREEVR